MKQVRMGVIVLLVCVGLVLIISEPSEGVGWFAIMFWKSLVGFGCWGVGALLWRVWRMSEQVGKYSDER